MALPAFTTTGVTEHQRNADLALYLLGYFEQRWDPADRIWLGERPLRSLQYTCQVLEALHRLNLQGITDRLADPGSAWLLDLASRRDLPAEELHSLRLHPSRFRTLARLGRWDPARLRADFADLTQLFDMDTGWIHKALFELNPTLITMIWADTLLNFEPLGLLDAQLATRRDRAMEALTGAFEAWCGRAAAALQESGALPDGLGHNRPGELANSGDASYALDLLRRAGRLRPDSLHSEEARQALTAAIRGRRPEEFRRSDLLYCGLHLRLHFTHHTETRDAVGDLIAGLRERYENDACQREPFSFHALVLSLLSAHHGDALREAMLEKLWLQSQTAAKEEQQWEQEQVEAEFVRLIRQSIRIHLSTPRRITGVRTRSQVYRVRFGLLTEATDENGAPLSSPRNSLLLIVKKGPPQVLARAIERYRDLPPPLQKLFARHAEPAEPHVPQPDYLIMQDLADMRPLSEVLGQLDRPVMRREEQEKTAAAAAAVAATLHTLHRYERQPSLVGAQFNLIYLAPILESLSRLCQPQAFPELRPWVNAELEVNGWTYRRPDRYMQELMEFEPVLRPPALSYVHGDCHSRNLMLSRDLAEAKFVDIDTLNKSEDYLLDYGLLIEDVVIYQSLPYGDEAGRLEWEEIQAVAERGRTPGNRITYPAFPQKSEAVMIFQRALLEHLETYADSVRDQHWKERLWLAIARGLLLLASRQLTSHTIEPHRRGNIRLVNDLKLVQVAYAEALRLLHELHEHLSLGDEAPLPELPFPGEHRLPLLSEADDSGLVSELVEALDKEFGGTIDRQPVANEPYAVEYFTRPAHRLFARLQAGEAPALHLACRPEQLDDPRHLGQPGGNGDLSAASGQPPGVQVPLAAPVAVADVLALVRQAYHLAVSADRTGPS